MSRWRPPLIAFTLGIACSFAFRFLAPPFNSGITVTTPKATYYYGGNLVSFWAMIALTLLISSYLYLARTRRQKNGADR